MDIKVYLNQFKKGYQKAKGVSKLRELYRRVNEARRRTETNQLKNK